MKRSFAIFATVALGVSAGAGRVQAADLNNGYNEYNEPVPYGAEPLPYKSGANEPYEPYVDGGPQYTEPPPIYSNNGTKYAKPYNEYDYRYQRPSLKDDYAEPYVAPVPPKRIYAQPKHLRHGYGCVPRHVVRRRLIARGWRDFRRMRVRRRAVRVLASRPNGMVYRLRIDRCTGVILNARLLRRHWRNGPRRFRRRIAIY